MKKMLFMILSILLLIPIFVWHYDLLLHYDSQLADSCFHNKKGYSDYFFTCYLTKYELDIILFLHPNFAEGFNGRFFLNVFELGKDYKKHPELLKDLDMAVKLDPWNPYNRFNQAFYSTNCNLKQLNYIKFKDEEYVCTTSYHVFGRLECVNQKDIEQLRKDTCECTSDKEFLENYCTEENI